MRIILVAALATVMCPSAGLVQTAKQKSPHVSSSPQCAPRQAKSFFELP
jgi:hypothetical protein